MSEQFKPGDVAMVTWNNAPFGKTADMKTAVAVRDDRKGGWVFGFTEFLSDGQTANVDIAATIRPLVVIDPEDPEQVDALTKAIVEAAHQHGNFVVSDNGIHPTTTGAALRSLIAPPKPEEPTGLGAVVEDAKGVRWTRVESTDLTRNPWHPADDADKQPAEYHTIAAVRVLSEGVQS